MARFRLARPADVDLSAILSTSAERWGLETTRRYAALIVAALRQVAADPAGPLTRARPELGADLRSFHMRHTRASGSVPPVKRPPHLLYYRVASDGVIEVVRVLHERMEPKRHVAEL
ncbi:MAG: type II toxin-antitoxin system RelE/ParE family toxin [Vicinamibacterales bacterium]